MTPHHKDRGQMFTREAVMYDDSNLNKNEFTGIVSFAVNFHFFLAQLMLRGHLPLLSSCLITLPFKWWEKGKDGEKRDGKGVRVLDGEKEGGEKAVKEEGQRGQGGDRH